MSNPLKLLFSDESHEDAARWYAQGLKFSPVLPNVLAQQKGGPCGVLAALQAHIVLKQVFENISNPKEALVEALQETLFRAWRAPSSDTNLNPMAGGIAIASRTEDATGPFDPKAKVEITRTEDVGEAKRLLGKLVDGQFASDAGIMLYVLSLIHSRGYDRVKADMDDPEALMTGQFGHCGQEMLNLIITGQAASQVHDGTVEIADTGLSLRGVTERPQVGLLTRLEALRYCKVGSFLKNPKFPIWVIGSDSHFTVLYSPDRDADSKSKDQELFERAKRIFQQRDNQENGFVKTQDVDGILRELGLVPRNEGEVNALQTFVNKCEMAGAEGIVIWTDFWPKISPILRSGKGIEALPNPNRSCPACTFINEDVNATQCVICGHALPPPSSQQASAQSTASASTPWTCMTCTLKNGANDKNCQACGDARAAQVSDANAREESQVGGKTIPLIHLDGLEKKINGQVQPPSETRLKLTTVDSILAAGAGTYGLGAPFEEVLQTKWPGAIFDYGIGGKPPSIVG